MKDDEIKDVVKEEYSKIAKSSESCCPSCGCGDTADQARSVGYSISELESIPEESIEGLGCGNPTALADLREGEKVLDLGSGAGIDVFLAAEKVGSGLVIGLDMTEEMVKKSERIAESYGYGNVKFQVGEMENLPFEEESFDVIVSNCVINLSTDKSRTFEETYRVLMDGGRIVVSDLVVQGELPEEIRQDKRAWAGCIAGALKKDEYLDKIKRAGFKNLSILSEDAFDADIPGVEIISLKLKAYK